MATCMPSSSPVCNSVHGMASRGRRGVPAREGEHRRDEPRREDQGEQQALAPQGPVLPPPPPVDYGRGAAPAAATVAAAPATGRPGRPRAPARVFALAREDAEQAEHVTEGADISTSSEEIVRSDSERE
ncbi:hypothetical protein Taro_048285 [Colocasia esculenta]|uniref:Uncharacterized protein n=1 Tax=Colocasia esculenta TaxID=4460 RepID=A0A843X858_COLES|nr:hypothetical protein [Colocasia esculenta]